MDGENIYDDLDNFILEQQVEKVQENNKELQVTIEKLEETTKKFNEEISELKTIKQNLERNISALFKTAKSEIERKDNQISELRKELDNLKFRRANNRKGRKGGENNEDVQKELEILKCVVEQKNRIIQSLTKELENVKQELLNQEKHLKRNASHFENDDLRSRLVKKRKLDDKRDKSRRPRSRSRSKSRETPRYDNRSKSRFDKKRTIRRNRSGSFEKRRNSIIEKHRSRRENSKYSKSRSRSPAPHKKHSNPSSKTSNSKYEEKIIKLKSRSRSSSIDRKKHHKHSEKPEVLANGSDKNVKCEKKAIHINHLIKEDSGMSSSNSHTSELLLKCDEIKAELLVLEDLKVDDLEEGEIDSTLEDINSEEDNIHYKEKDCLKKESTRKTLKEINSKIEKTVKTEINTKIDKTKMISKIDKTDLKSNKLNEGAKKIMINKSDLENIVVNEKEVKPVEKENKHTDTTTITTKPPELGSELVTRKPVVAKENEIIDGLKSPHDVLELMVQSNFLDELDIDEEIVKMRLFEDEKRKKRKEDKDRISKLRSAISECKQNIELLEHNFSSDEESETEDGFNKTGTCANGNVVNTKQNNLVLKISKGSIVVSNVEPKTDTLKDDENQTQIQITDRVSNKNPLDTSNQPESVDTIQKQIPNDVLDTNPIDTKQKPEDFLDKNAIETSKTKENTKAKIQKSNEVLPKNIFDADRKESTKNVKSKSSKEIPKIEDSKSSKESSELRADKDIQMKKNKSLEDDNRKKRIGTNEKCSKIITSSTSSKHIKPEKITTNKNIIKTIPTNDKIETCVQESVEFRPKLAEKISEHELLEAISTIVDDVKLDGPKFEQNFANITNLEGVVTDGPATLIRGDPLESKLNEIFDAQTEKKENVSQEMNDNNKEAKNAT